MRRQRFVTGRHALASTNQHEHVPTGAIMSLRILAGGFFRNEVAVPTFSCPVCHRHITVKKEHHQKRPPHDDHKGRPCPGTGRGPLLGSEPIG